MKYIYSHLVFAPDNFDNNWCVVYYCTHSIGRFPSESNWIVPGTLED